MRQREVIMNIEPFGSGIHFITTEAVNGQSSAMATP
jgi:hypothetical protein